MPRIEAPSAHAATPRPPRQGTAPVRRVSSVELMAGASEVVITHSGREYRLRVTQNGKLILTA